MDVASQKQRWKRKRGLVKIPVTNHFLVSWRHAMTLRRFRTETQESFRCIRYARN
jgi:hypothetical protein